MKPQLSESPHARCLGSGARCLSLRECLSLILGGGEDVPLSVPGGRLADQILKIPGAGLGPFEEEKAFFTFMESTGGAHLKTVAGLGTQAQARVLAAFEMGRRYSLYRYSYHKLRSRERSLPRLALLAREIISPEFRLEPKEWLGFIPVHRTGELGGLCVVEQGARTHVNVDPIELFARILALRPLGFFLVHNHPSGSVSPSREDRDLTSTVGKVSDQLGVQLFGHWIVSPQTECLIPYFDNLQKPL